MGAKLIGIMFENKQISSRQAESMMSFCSVSGPMFMLGTVGVMMLKSYKAGLIILIANITACLINGLIFKNKDLKFINTNQLSNDKNSNLLSECVYDSLMSILMVGAYVVLSFLIIEILNTFKFFDLLSHAICSVFCCAQYQSVVKSCLCGIIEITRGILEISTNTTISLPLKTILASSMISFGGVSIMFQNMNFISKLHISKKRILIQKFLQALICLVISFILCLLFF